MAITLIEETKEKLAADKRVAIFDIQFINDSLLGETNLPEAHEALIRSFKANDIEFSDGIDLLPEEKLGAQTMALVTNSVANLRSEAKHSAELSTQALLGTPLNLLKKMGSWYLVQTPDRYISWVDASAIQLLDQDKMNEWTGKPKLMVTEMTSYVYEDINFATLVSDLTAGNVLELLNESDGDYHVRLPDGRSGFVSKTDALPYEIWKNTRNTNEENLVKTAKNMMGVPYLWGGTSTKGVDCSGFTKTIFFLNGMIIPRDASQQIREGEEVDRDKNWDKLEIGDLLFFGVPATDSTSERVVHVGMWIGNRSFIHSRGRVRISSLDPKDENYDEYEYNRYLRTKRIKDGSSENILAVEKILQ
ncbi:MAG: C40 family peptidase [Cyclobacteriaceae bacterium]